MFKRILKISLLVTILGLYSTSYAGDPSTGDFSNVENTWYAETFKVSENEAKRRSLIISKAIKVANSFEKNEKKFSGIAIQHEPKFKIFFNIKKKRCHQNRGWGGHRRHWHRCKNKHFKKRLKKALKHEFHDVKKWRKYIKIKKVKSSIFDLKKIQNKVSNIAEKYAKSGFMSAIDIRHNKIILSVLNKSLFKYELYSNGIFLPKSVVIKESTGLPQNYAWGGATIYNGTDRCTTGFVVIRAGKRGILSAGHCKNYTSWQGTGSGLTHVSTINETDVAYFTLSSILESQAKNRIQIGTWQGNPAYRNITSVGSLSTGQNICFYGSTSKLQCGVVAATNINLVKQGVQRTGMTIVTRNGAYQGGDISTGGDSGAPVFSGSTALGLISGGSGKDTLISPVNNLSPLGVSILTQ